MNKVTQLNKHDYDNNKDAVIDIGVEQRKIQAAIAPIRKIAKIGIHFQIVNSNVTLL